MITIVVWVEISDYRVGKRRPVVAIVGWRRQWSQPSDHNSSELPPSGCCHPAPSCTQTSTSRLWPKHLPFVFNPNIISLWLGSKISTTHQHLLSLAIGTFSLDQDAATISSAQPQILSTIVIKTNRCLNNIDGNVRLSELHHNVNWSSIILRGFQVQMQCESGFRAFKNNLCQGRLQILQENCCGDDDCSDWWNSAQKGGLGDLEQMEQ